MHYCNVRPPHLPRRLPPPRAHPQKAADPLKNPARLNKSPGVSAAHSPNAKRAKQQKSWQVCQKVRSSCSVGAKNHKAEFSRFGRIFGANQVQAAARFLRNLHPQLRPAKFREHQKNYRLFYVLEIRAESAFRAEIPLRFFQEVSVQLAAGQKLAARAAAEIRGGSAAHDFQAKPTQRQFRIIEGHRQTQQLQIPAEKVWRGIVHKKLVVEIWGNFEGSCFFVFGAGEFGKGGGRNAESGEAEFESF